MIIQQVLIFPIFLLVFALPFCHTLEMIESDENYSVYYPFRKWKSKRRPLLAPPKVWIRNYEEQIYYLHPLVDISTYYLNITTFTREMYLNTLSSYLLADHLGKFEKSVIPHLHSTNKLGYNDLNEDYRTNGQDWPLFGQTMTGRIRIQTTKRLLEDVISNDIPGDILEAGVWRGGLSIYMRAILIIHNQTHRKSFLCDSFQGLPSSTLKHDTHMTWDVTPYLSVSDELVMNNFISSGIIDPNIVFVKGFFTYSMKPLTTMIQNLSILRLDGDMYESTVDVLYHFYEKLSLGGYVYIDDYLDFFPARQACEHFFKAHNFFPKVIEPDSWSGYWQKTHEIKVQYWRYLEKKFVDE